MTEWTCKVRVFGFYGEVEIEQIVPNGKRDVREHMVEQAIIAYNKLKQARNG